MLTSISILCFSYWSSWQAIPFSTIQIGLPPANIGPVQSSHFSVKMPALADLNINGKEKDWPGRRTPNGVQVAPLEYQDYCVLPPSMSK